MRQITASFVNGQIKFRCCGQAFEDKSGHVTAGGEYMYPGCPVCDARATFLIQCRKITLKRHS